MPAAKVLIVALARCGSDWMYAAKLGRVCRLLLIQGAPEAGRQPGSPSPSAWAAGAELKATLSRMQLP